jgi:hypothetical protein
VKYLVLILAAGLGLVAIRMQSQSLASKMYVEGCFDASIKLQRLNMIQESYEIAAFCNAREKALINFVDLF